MEQIEPVEHSRPRVVILLGLALAAMSPSPLALAALQARQVKLALPAGPVGQRAEPVSLPGLKAAAALPEMPLAALVKSRAATGRVQPLAEMASAVVATAEPLVTAAAPFSAAELAVGHLARAVPLL